MQSASAYKLTGHRTFKLLANTRARLTLQQCLSADLGCTRFSFTCRRLSSVTPAAVRGAGLAAVDTERSWPAAATSEAAEGFEAGAETEGAAMAMAAVVFMGGACGTAATVSGGAMGTVKAGAVGTAYAAKIKQKQHTQIHDKFGHSSVSALQHNLALTQPQ